MYDRSPRGPFTGRPPRGPSREHYWAGLGGSTAIHIVVIFTLLVAASEASQDAKMAALAFRVIPSARVLEVTFGAYSVESAGAPLAAYADEPIAAPPRARSQSAPTQPDAPTVVAVGTPRPAEAPPPERPSPAPQAEVASEAPVPGSALADGGTPMGGAGTSTSPGNGGSGNGTGTGNGSGLAVEGLGSRRATCPPPRHPGVGGTVTYAVTFAPDGHYVSARPLRRGGDARLDAAVRTVLSGCRAAALPVAASQVNQAGQLTFRFTG